MRLRLNIQELMTKIKHAREVRGNHADTYLEQRAKLAHTVTPNVYSCAHSHQSNGTLASFVASDCRSDGHLAQPIR